MSDFDLSKDDFKSCDDWDKAETANGKIDADDFAFYGGTDDGVPSNADDNSYFDAPAVNGHHAERGKRGEKASGKPKAKPAGGPEGGLKLTSFDNIKAERAPWLWHGRIVAGAVTVLGSDPGLGKGNIVCDLAARITRGRAWPDDAATCGSSDVILANAEDDPASVLAPRLRAAGADLSRVHLIECVAGRDSAGNVTERAFTLEHVAELDERLKQLARPKLVVIDPLGSYMGGADSYKDSDVRGLFAPLVELARRHGVAVLVVMHRRKTFSRSADESLLGSGTRGLARMTWHVYADHEDDEHTRRFLVQGKNNVGKRMTGLAFRVVGETVCADDGGTDIETCRVEWDREVIDRTADDLHLAEQSRVGRKSGDDEEKASKLDEADAFLADFLRRGPTAWADVVEAGRQAGHRPATLIRARERTAEVFKEAGKRDGKSYWRLPGDEQTEPVPYGDEDAQVDPPTEEDAQVAQVAQLRFSDPKTAIPPDAEPIPSDPTPDEKPVSTPETELAQLAQLAQRRGRGKGKSAAKASPKGGKRKPEVMPVPPEVEGSGGVLDYL